MRVRVMTLNVWNVEGDIWLLDLTGKRLVAFNERNLPHPNDRVAMTRRLSLEWNGFRYK